MKNNHQQPPKNQPPDPTPTTEPVVKEKLPAPAWQAAVAFVEASRALNRVRELVRQTNEILVCDQLEQSKAEAACNKAREALLRVIEQGGVE